MAGDVEARIRARLHYLANCTGQLAPGATTSSTSTSPGSAQGLRGADAFISTAREVQAAASAGPDQGSCSKDAVSRKRHMLLNMAVSAVGDTTGAAGSGTDAPPPVKPHASKSAGIAHAANLGMRGPEGLRDELLCIDRHIKARLQEHGVHA